jgi:CRISPR type III-B/RAMP module RAMP protein Cmr6
MSINAPPDTQAALGKGLMPKCQSRALFKDRFADPEAGEGARKDWFSAMVAKSAERSTVRSWHPKKAVLLYARLMSRLMVDLAGGVMENANVQLDRYGIPVIPGSAVKGCARRMALQALHDWVEAGTVRPAADDACKPCCEGFACPAEMLAAIARVFGWTPEDWKADKKDGHYKSDFAWAVNGNGAILEAAKGINPPCGTFGGSIAFLMASPNRDPGLELDVVTPHHTRYYKGELKTATDTEDPIPVFFPAVKAQSESEYFTFPLIPLRLAETRDLNWANCWLARGLEIIGIGAKTNAGYGWFNASESLQGGIREKIEAFRKADEERERRDAERSREQFAAEAARIKREQEAAATANLSEDEKEDWKVEQLTAAQFENKVKNFFKEPKKGGPAAIEKKAIVRALRGPRLEFWRDFKAKSTKGDPARSVSEIIALNKELNKDKMP